RNLVAARPAAMSLSLDTHRESPVQTTNGGNGRRADASAPRARLRGARRVPRASKAELERVLVELAAGLEAVRDGDFGVRLRTDSAHPFAAEIAATFNAVVRKNDRLAGELARVARSVGVEGRLDDRAALPGAGGTWARSVESVNALVESMAWP